MKKILLGLVGFILMLTGCKMSDPQILVIAKQTGLVTVIMWTTIDNPQEEVKFQVKNIISVIVEKSSQVKAGESYAGVLFPVIDSIITEKVSEQYVSLVRLGTNSLLSGIDLLFAMYPEVSQKEELAVKIVYEFCSGAQEGLSLNESDPIMKAIQPGLQSRNIIIYNNQENKI